MDLNVKLKEEYISGMSLKTESIRKYKYTIEEGEHKGRYFYSEIYTPKISEHKYGKEEVSFYFDNEEEVYHDIKDLIKKL